MVRPRSSLRQRRAALCLHVDAQLSVRAACPSVRKLDGLPKVRAVHAGRFAQRRAAGRSERHAVEKHRHVACAAARILSALVVVPHPQAGHRHGQASRAGASGQVQLHPVVSLRTDSPRHACCRRVRNPLNRLTL